MRVRVHCIAALLVALLTLTPSLALAQTYVHGFLRYEVVDQSVTITGYAGDEGTVTVPAMIGGNPVNTIGAGAFADASKVTVVYLPDTVTTVEPGAFGAGQAVVFGGRASGDSSTSSPEQGSDATPSQEPSAGEDALGIHTDDGSLVTVDDEGHLVLVDPSGTERVLDDSRSYSRTTRPDGTPSIVNDAGDEVVVADGSKVSFSDAEGRQVVVDTMRETTTTTAEDGSYGHEEVDVDESAAEASGAESSEAAETAAPKAQGSGIGLMPLVAAVVAAAAAVILWKRSKRQ